MFGKDKEYKIVYEVCPHCGEEHGYKISDGKIQQCKNCKKEIILCALCEKQNCSKCKYKKEVK